MDYCPLYLQIYEILQDPFTLLMRCNVSGGYHIMIFGVLKEMKRYHCAKNPSISDIMPSGHISYTLKNFWIFRVFYKSMWIFKNPNCCVLDYYGL